MSALLFLLLFISLSYEKIVLNTPSSIVLYFVGEEGFGDFVQENRKIRDRGWTSSGDDYDIKTLNIFIFNLKCGNN